MFAKQTCHGAKRSMLASRRYVWFLSFTGGRTKALPYRDRGKPFVRSPPKVGVNNITGHRCSHNFTTKNVACAHQRKIPTKASPFGRGDGAADGEGCFPKRKKTETHGSPSFCSILTLQYSLIFLALSSPSTLIKLLIPSYPADM